MENHNNVKEDAPSESSLVKPEGDDTITKFLSMIFLCIAVLVLIFGALMLAPILFSEYGPVSCNSKKHLEQIPGRYNHTNIVEIKKGSNYKICSLQNRYGVNYTYRVQKTVDGEPNTTYLQGLFPPSRFE